MYFDASVMLPDSVKTVINAGDSGAKEFSMMLCVEKCPTEVAYFPKAPDNSESYIMCEYIQTLIYLKSYHLVILQLHN